MVIERIVRLLASLLVLLRVGTIAVWAEDFGSFLSPLIYRGVDNQERIVEVMAPFSFKDPHGKIWTVPPGARVDGASIPRAFWTIIGAPFTGRYREASVVHDYYCETKSEPWQVTHRAFYDGMRANGVDPATAKVMYAAVYGFGPRWVKTSNENQDSTVIAGMPSPTNKLDVRALAARPDITPEKIRQEIDKALSVSADEAKVELAKDPTCSVVVQPLGETSGSSLLCQLDGRARRLVATRNLSVLSVDLKTLLAANNQTLIPMIDRYVSNPTEDNWRAVKVATEEVQNLVTLTMLSLAQYDKSLDEMVSAGAAGEFYRSTKELKQVLRMRSIALEQNRVSPPRSAAEVRRWKDVYLELLRRLERELAGMEHQLR
jgi:Protein of unknown function (DUF1353)